MERDTKKERERVGERERKRDAELQMDCNQPVSGEDLALEVLENLT